MRYSSGRNNNLEALGIIGMVEDYPNIYLGLISGTSMDGIDVVAIRFDSSGPTLLDALLAPYSEELRTQLSDFRRSDKRLSPENFGHLDREIGLAFGLAALQVMERANLRSGEIRAIGSHGQTVWHAPGGEHGFSLQLGDPNTIASLTGVTTVADFRRADIAVGGQGAPLAPLFHDYLVTPSRHPTAIINLGGIANVSLLAPNKPVVGFDTGPANGLMDQWMQHHHDQAFDHDGQFASTGVVDQALLDALLLDPYFQQAPPKSTGFEHFNLDWLTGRDAWRVAERESEDVMATLLELTAATVCQPVIEFGAKQYALVGGGRSNAALVHSVAAKLQQAQPFDISELGIDADWIEASLFAWLAHERLADHLIDTRRLTGARQAVLMGGIYAAGESNQ